MSISSKASACWLIGLVSLWASVTLAQNNAATSPLPPGGAESVDVELTTLPFYAVDERGEPVHDLRRDEIELVVDGQTIESDVFDSWTEAARVDAPLAVVAGSTAVERISPPRHVFLFFDQAFSTPDGLKRSQGFARDLLDRYGDQDRLYLLTYHSQTGFQQQVGPVRGDSDGKRALRREIKSLRMNVERLRSKTRLPPPGPQQNWAFVQAANIVKSEYRDAAIDLANSWQALAAGLGRVQGQKVLIVFSSGIDSGLYFDGSYGLGPGSTQAHHGKEWFFEPIANRFQVALDALAASGALPIFVDLQTKYGKGRSPLHHMSDVTGGLYLEDGAPEVFEKKIVAATSAFYEVGFYGREELSRKGPPRIELTTSRAGVRLIFPKRIKTRQSYAALSDMQKQVAIVELIGRGRPGPVLNSLAKLEGRVAQSPNGRRLRFEGAWPEQVRGREMDLYEVALRLREKGEPELLRFDRRRAGADRQPVLAETARPKGHGLIWGIVAVDPSTGDVFYQRLMLQKGPD